MKSSAGLSDALLAMVAMLLLRYLFALKAVEYLVFGCVTIAKSRRLAKDIDRAFQVRQQSIDESSFLEWKLKARTRHVTRFREPRRFGGRREALP
jgi:hypothetical protein